VKRNLYTNKNTLFETGFFRIDFLT